MTMKKRCRKFLILSAVLAVILFSNAACAGDTSSNTIPGSQDIDMPADQSYTPSASNLVQVSAETAKNIPATIEEVEMRYYEDDTPSGRWPYLHWVITNNSEKTITGYEMVLLAYDIEGKPLKLIWEQLMYTDGDKITGFHAQSELSYENLVTTTANILPGDQEDLDGGWSLWDGWDHTNGTHKVAYPLACMKQVTFDDGTVWENTEYKNWISSYKGKEIAVDTLSMQDKA